MLTSIPSSSVHNRVVREASVLREINRFSYCASCHKPCYLSCDSCREPAFQVFVYLHNVPKVNGLPERDDECAACQLLKRPQTSFSELHMCERELDGVFDSGSAKSQKELIEQIDYFVDMSAEAIFVCCPHCCEVASRSEFPAHACKF